MADTYSGDEISQQTVEIAHNIETVMAGRSTGACYLAIGLVLGNMASRAREPDLDALFIILRAAAQDEFDREMQRRAG